MRLKCLFPFKCNLPEASVFSKTLLKNFKISSGVYSVKAYCTCITKGHLFLGVNIFIPAYIKIAIHL